MIYKITKICYLIFIFLIEAGVPLSASGYLFQHLSINQGLSQSSVRAILQDDFGYLWFATQDGLNRYDGYEFKVFRHISQDSNSISNNFIYAMDEDTKGNIWTATQNGFCMYNVLTDKFENFYIDYKKKSTAENAVFYIKCSKISPEIYLGTLDGLIEFNPIKKTFKKYGEPTDTSINYKSYLNVIHEDESGILWLGFSGGGFFRFNKFKNEFRKIELIPKYTQSELIFRSVTSIYDTHDGYLWVGAFSGLYRCNTKTCEVEYIDLYVPGFPEFKTNLNISSIEMGKNGNLWVGTTGGGVYFYDIKHRKSRLILSDPQNSMSLSSNTIMSIKRDKTGIIWLGTFGSGIDKYNPDFNRFGLENKSTGLPVSSLRTFYRDKNILWIGGYGAGLIRYDEKSEHYSILTPQKNNFTTNNIYKILPDKKFPDKFLWLGTDGGGLVKFNINTKEFIKYPYFILKKSNALSGTHVQSLIFDKSGYLWIGTESGLNRLNIETSDFRQYYNKPDDSTSLLPGSITSLLIDSENNFWVGSNLGGFAKFDENTGKFIRFTHSDKDNESISSNSIKCIIEDNKHRIWIGTSGGGISLFNPRTGKFKNITIKEGLPNDVIYGILEDNNSNLWLSSNSGIIKYNPETGEIKTYIVNDGLQSNEFNTNAFYKSSDGKLYFGGINGFNSFYPDSILINRSQPQVGITHFYLFNTPIDQNFIDDGKKLITTSLDLIDEIHLKYNQNMISFQLASLDFHSPSKNMYSYKLDGFDNRWIEIGTKRYFTYTNLDPGTYSLKLKATNNDGVWSDSSRVVKIIISPPFWDTTLFKLGIIIVLILTVLLFIKLRLKTERERNKKLELIVKERTEELEWLNDALKKSEKNLIELNATKDKFFSIVAHDLKNPLAAITGFSDLISNNYESFTQEEFIEISGDIYKTSKLLNNLLDNLLTWSRSQSGSIAYSPHNFDFYGELDNILQIISQSAQAKNISIFSEVQKGSYVYADSNMINTVMRNLLSNAVKFTPANGQIIIRWVPLDGFARIIVEDTGIGISGDDIKKLFRIDVQHTSIGTSSEHGTGLGLVLCKEFVEKNNGKISVESRLGIGSKFIFTLPLEGIQEAYPDFDNLF